MKKSLLILVSNYGLGHSYYSHGLSSSVFLLTARVGIGYIYIYILKRIPLASKIKTFFKAVNFIDIFFLISQNEIFPSLYLRLLSRKKTMLWRRILSLRKTK